MTVSELSRDLDELLLEVKNYTNEFALLSEQMKGSDGKESMPTRLKLVENYCDRLQSQQKDLYNRFEICKERHGSKTDIELIKLRNDLENIANEIILIKSNLDNVKKDLLERINKSNNRIEKLETFKEASKNSWKNYFVAFIKWIGFIISAYITFKLTGK